MTDDSDASHENWWLVSHGEKPGPGHAPPITLWRKLEPSEAEEVRRANGLVKRLTGVAPYSRLVELFEELEKAAEQKASFKRRAVDLNRAARALGKAAADLPNRLRESVKSDFGPGDELEAMESAITEECERAPLRLSIVVGTLRTGPFKASDDGIENDPDAITEIAAELAGVTPALSIFEGLSAGVVVAQRLIARQLEIYRDSIEKATLVLRVLAAEVPTGAPGLMQDERLDLATEKIELGSPTFDGLALAEGQYLHRAIVASQRLLQETDEQLRELEVTPADPQPESAGDAPSVDQADEVPGANDVTVTDADDSEVESVEAHEGGREDQVVDLRLLFDHTLEFTDALERAWSDALDKTQLAEAHSELGARFGSLLRSVHRRAAASDRELRASGFDPTIPQFPLAATQIEALTFSPDPEQRWRQLQLAEVEALQLLLKALEALRRPSAQTVMLATGETKSWWEAGAFDLVRVCARQLLHVTEAAGHAQRDITGPPGADETVAGELFDRLRLASQAVGRGDSEAALSHCLVALRQRSAGETPEVPDDLPHHLAAHIQNTTHSALLLRLGEASAALQRGEALDIGAVTLIAPRVLALTGFLCVEQPELLRQALGIGEAREA